MDDLTALLQADRLPFIALVERGLRKQSVRTGPGQVLAVLILEFLHKLGPVWPDEAAMAEIRRQPDALEGKELPRLADERRKVADWTLKQAEAELQQCLQRLAFNARRDQRRNQGPHDRAALLLATVESGYGSAEFTEASPHGRMLMARIFHDLGEGLTSAQEVFAAALAEPEPPPATDAEAYQQWAVAQLDLKIAACTAQVDQRAKIWGEAFDTAFRLVSLANGGIASRHPARRP